MSNGDRYRRERGLPRFQPGDTSGFSRAAAETGQQAAATGAAAQAIGARARVLEEVGEQSYRIGAELAQQRGQMREIEPMRDAQGNLVPLVQRVTLNLEQKAYQDRQLDAWGVQALNAFKERSLAEAQKHRMDPQAYSDAMAEVKQDILSRAPGALSGRLEAQFDDYTLGARNGIQSLVTRTDQMLADQGIEQNLSRVQQSFLAGAIREENLQLFVDGKPNPDIYDELLASRETIPLLSSGEQPDSRYTPRHRAWADDVARLGFQGWFDNKARSANRLHQYDPSRAMASLLNAQQLIEEDKVRVPGWAGAYTEEPGSVLFSQLDAQSQQNLRAHMERQRQRIGANAEFRNNYRHERFQEAVIPVFEEVRRSYPQDIPDRDLRTHVDALTASKPNLSQSFVRSVIWNESRNNPLASSPTGVVGMMQVTENTGRAMAARRGRVYDANRQNPYSSSEYGIEYLSLMMDQARGWCPNCSQGQQQALAAAAYNRGPGMLDQVKAKGADMSNPDSWMPVLASLKNGQEGVTFAKRVMNSQSTLAGGMGAVVEGVSQRAMQEFQNPLDYMRAMTRFHSNWTQANSWAAYNQSLVHSPPAYDADLAKAFVDPLWEARFNPGVPNPQQMAGLAAESIVRMVQTDTPFGHAVKMEALTRANKAMRSGATVQASRAQQLLQMQGQRPHSEDDARQLSKTMPGGADPRPLDKFKADVAAGKPVVSERILRYTNNGMRSNGRPDVEQLDLTDLGMRELAAGSLNEEEIMPFISLLESFYGSLVQPGEDIRFSREVTDQMNAVFMARDAVKRLRPGPGGSGAGMLAAMDYAMLNRNALRAGDKDAYEKLRRILWNKPLDDLWKDTSAEFQVRLGERIGESVSAGAPYYYRNRAVQAVDILPGLGNVSNSIPDMVMNESIKLRHLMDLDTADSAVDYADESLLKKGAIGFSQYTFDHGLIGNDGYDPTKPALVKNPIDFHVSKYALVMPEHYEAMKNVRLTMPSEPGVERFDNLMVDIWTGQVDEKGDRIMESVSAMRGTLPGAAQAAFDDRGIEANAAQEMRDGKLLFFPIRRTFSPSGHPAVMLQAMRFERIGGDTEGSWEPRMVFDTGELEEIVRTPKYGRMHIEGARASAPWTQMPMNILKGLGFDADFSEMRNPLRELGQELRNITWALTLGLDFPRTEPLPERLQPNIPE